MKNNLSISLVIILFTALNSACYYDVEEVLYPKTDCITLDISYTEFVQPLIDQLCYTCHANGANQGSVDIGNYNQLKIMVDNGRFIGAIRHDSGFSSMPRNSPKMLDCQINKIESWIQDGALNN